MLHLIYMMCLFTCISADPSTLIDYISLGTADLYKDKTINILCSASGYRDLRSLQLQYDDEEDNKVYSTGCTRSSGDERVWVASSAPDIHTLSGIAGLRVSDANCEFPSGSNFISFIVQFVITESTIGGMFSCKGVEGGVGEISSQEVPVEVKVGPQSLILNASDAVEGEDLNFSCKSRDAKPVSEYEYKVNNQSVSQHTYIPEKADRDGVLLSCRDIIHTNWEDGNTETSVLLKPKYIDVKSEAVSTIILQVIAEDGGVELDCDLYVIGNPKPTTFFWVRVGVTQLEETDPSLNLTAQTAGTNEKVMCTAGNSFGKNVTVTWHIEWQSISEKSSNDAETNYQNNLMTRSNLSFIIFSIAWKYMLT